VNKKYNYTFESKESTYFNKKHRSINRLIYHVNFFNRVNLLIFQEKQ